MEIKQQTTVYERGEGMMPRPKLLGKVVNRVTFEARFSMGEPEVAACMKGMLALTHISYRDLERLGGATGTDFCAIRVFAQDMVDLLKDVQRG